MLGGGRGTGGAALHSHPGCPLFLYIESPLSWNRRESTANIWMAKVLNFSRWLPFPRLLSYFLITAALKRNLKSPLQLPGETAVDASSLALGLIGVSLASFSLPPRGPGLRRQTAWARILCSQHLCRKGGRLDSTLPAGL